MTAEELYKGIKDIHYGMMNKVMELPLSELDDKEIQAATDAAVITLINQFKCDIYKKQLEGFCEWCRLNKVGNAEYWNIQALLELYFKSD